MVLLKSFQKEKQTVAKDRNHRLLNTNTTSQKTMKQKALKMLKENYF